MPVGDAHVKKIIVVPNVQNVQMVYLDTLSVKVTSASATFQSLEIPN